MICPQFINTFYVVMQYVLYMCTYIQLYFYVLQRVQFHVIHSNFKMLFYFIFFLNGGPNPELFPNPPLHRLENQGRD